MPDLLVAGAGMAGLVAAVQARQRGAEVVVLEKGGRPGGAMLLSSGVVWRHRDFDRFRAECPDGDARLQRLVIDRLDEDLAWLCSLGVTVVEWSTRNPRTVGMRFDPVSLTAALVDSAGPIRYGRALEELPSATPVVLATGGFPGSVELVATHVTPEAPWVFVRSTGWSTGDGLRLGLGAGGRTSRGMDEFYGRAMPAPPARIGGADFVAAAQLYASHARVEAAGERTTARTWSEIDVVQWMALRPRARARFTVDVGALGARVGGRTVGEMIAQAERAG
ncbi:MAG: FAD-dependent oxidoreductase, partial [Gaiella sp.]